MRPFGSKAPGIRRWAWSRQFDGRVIKVIPIQSAAAAYRGSKGSRCKKDTKLPTLFKVNPTCSNRSRSRLFHFFHFFIGKYRSACRPTSGTEIDQRTRRKRNELVEALSDQMKNDPHCTAPCSVAGRQTSNMGRNSSLQYGRVSD